MTTLGRRLRDRDLFRDLLLAVLGSVLLLRQVWHAARTPGIDFAHVWYATHQLLAGSGAYGDPLFTYPPGSALLLAPFGLLPYSGARLAMLAVNVAAVLSAAWLTLVVIGWRSSRTALAVTLLALGALDAVASTWANGNVNGIVVLLEVLAIRSIQTGRWQRAAVLVGLSLSVKPVLVPVLVVFVVRRQWRTLMTAVAVPVSLSLLGWWLVPDAHRFVDAVLPFLMRGAQLPFNDSFMGVGHTLGVSGVVVSVVRVGVGCTAAVLIGRRALRSTASIDAASLVHLELGIALAAAFLVAPMSESYYTLFLLPSLAWWASRNLSFARIAAFVTVACFGTLRLPGVPGDIAHMTLLSLRPSLGWLALLVCFGAALRSGGLLSAANQRPLLLPGGGAYRQPFATNGKSLPST